MLPNIQAVLLDLYGTLAYIPVSSYVKAKERMAAVVGCKPDDFQKIWRSLSTLSTLGELTTTEDRVNATLARMNIKASKKKIHEMARIEIELQEKSVILLPGAIDCFNKLRQLNLKVALVTNCSSSSIRVPRLLGISQLVDAVILSFKVCVVKPDPAIYYLACSKINTEPGFCVFAGDGDCYELDGAKKVGMTTVLVGGTEDLALHLNPSTSYDYSISFINELPDVVRMIMQ